MAITTGKWMAYGNNIIADASYLVNGRKVYDSKHIAQRINKQDDLWLIEQAPEMLRMLKEITSANVYGDVDAWNETISNCLSVISKAEGREKP